MPAAIMVQTGLCFEIAETRAAAKGALAAATADFTVDGVLTTFRSTAILAVADTLSGLRPTMVQPKQDPNPLPLV